MPGPEQHTTPRLLLKGFIDDDGMLIQYDLQRRSPERKGRNAVTFCHDIYTDDVEDLMAPIENGAAVVIQRLRNGAYAMPSTDAEVLAKFVALQLVRVPAIHRLWREMEECLGRLRPYVDGVSPAFKGKEGENEKMAVLMDGYWREIAAQYSLCVMTFPPLSLVTSDVPVLLIPAPYWKSPIEVRTASGIFIAVSDSVGLMYRNRMHAPKATQLIDFAATAENAVAMNQAVVAQTMNQVMWHPDSQFDDLLGSGYEFPPFQDRALPAGFDENNKKMERHLKWMSENPEEAAKSAFARCGAPTMPSNARPLSVKTRRQLFSPADEES